MAHGRERTKGNEECRGLGAQCGYRISLVDVDPKDPLF